MGEVVDIDEVVVPPVRAEPQGLVHLDDSSEDDCTVAASADANMSTDLTASPEPEDLARQAKRKRSQDARPDDPSMQLDGCNCRASVDAAARQWRSVGISGALRALSL